MVYSIIYFNTELIHLIIASLFFFKWKKFSKFLQEIEDRLTLVLNFIFFFTSFI